MKKTNFDNLHLNIAFKFLCYGAITALATIYCTFYFKTLHIDKVNEYLGQHFGLASVSKNNFFLVLGTLFFILSLIFSLIAFLRLRPLKKLAIAYKIYAKSVETDLKASKKATLNDIVSAFLEVTRGIKTRKFEMKNLHESTKRLSGCLDVESLLQHCLDAIGTVITAKKGSIMLIENDCLIVKDSFGWQRDKVVGKHFYLTEGFAKEISKAKKAMIINDVMKSNHFKADRELIDLGGNDPMMVWKECKRLLCVPIMLEDKVKGAINIQDRLDDQEFAVSDVEYAEILASSMAVALENIERVRDEKQRLETLVNERTKELALVNEQLNDKNKQLEEFAIRDVMSGLHNYRFFAAQSKTMFQNARVTNTPITCFFFDVDKFKSVNDGCSHQFGDYVIGRIGAILKSCMRPSDLLARYGGDEYVVILPDTTYEQAIPLAKKLRESVENENFEFERFSKKITISIGIACYPDDAMPDEITLVKFADIALYKSKKTGRNTFSCFKDIEYQNSSFLDNNKKDQ